MQATMQTQFYLNPILTRMNTLSGGGASSLPSRTSAFDDRRNPPSQMSSMASGFSKSTFSAFGRNTSNGQSSTFFAQASTVNRGPAARPMPASCARNDTRGYNDYSRGGNGTSQGQHCGCNDSGRADQTQWSNTPVSNNMASIDLGDYKLDLNKSGSQITMTNKATGDTTSIHGDPHIDQHASSANKTSATFNGPLTFMLPDSTKVTVGTQADKNNAAVSFADNVTITKGNQAYQVTNLNGQASGPLDIQKSNNGRALDAATPDGYTLVAARNGSGWIDPATGKQPTADDFRKAA